MNEVIQEQRVPTCYQVNSAYNRYSNNCFTYGLDTLGNMFSQNDNTDQCLLSESVKII